MNVFAAMAVLALLIAVHEAGHFLAATLLGMRVSGFSIGFGPALIKRQRRGHLCDPHAPARRLRRLSG